MQNDSLLVISNNVRGINSNKKRSVTMQILMKEDPDVLLMQETRLHDIKIIRDFKEIHSNYHVFVNLKNSAKLGFITLIKKSLNVTVVPKMVKTNFCLKVQLQNKDSLLNIYNIHMPHRPRDRIKVLDSIKGDLCRNSAPSVLAGDWNMAGIKERMGLMEWASSLGFKVLKSDFEKANNMEISTFFRGGVQSRLDYIFISEGLKGYNLNFIINPLSDHIGLKFDLPFVGKGLSSRPRKYRSFWTFRPKWWFLKENDIKKIVNDCILSLKEYNADLSPQLLWSLTKLLIKQKIADLQKSTIKILYDGLHKVDQEITDLVNSSLSSPILLQNKKNQMSRYLDKIYKIRRPASNVLYHSDNLSFLKGQYAKYKKKSNSIVFDKLSSPVSENEVIEGGQQIAEALREEYLSRTRSDNERTNYVPKIFKNQITSSKFFMRKEAKLSSELQEGMNLIPTLDEYKTALQDKSHSTLPGPDGLNSHFYGIANEEIFKLAYRAKIQRIDDLSITRSSDMVSALLFPIPKRSPLGDPLKWNEVVKSSQIRFIALINTDDKAWDRLLNARLNLVLPSIVHKFCFSVPKRNLQQAILLSELLADKRNITSRDKFSIIKLDFRNAFDLTSQEQLMVCLSSSIGSGWLYKQIVHSVQNRMVSVKYANFTSKKIRCSVGLLQGCPLSASLYTLYMNILADKVIRFNRGIPIGSSGSSVKVIHFIDDMIIACRDSTDVVMAWKIVREFCQVTGAILNESKSESLQIFVKSSKTTIENKVKLEKKLSSAQLYGMFPFGDQREGSSKIFKKIMEQIDTQIANQSLHSLSLSTKVQIINTIFVSKFSYFLPVMKITLGMIQQFTSKCSRFLWKGLVQVPMKFVILPKRYGGLGLINLKNLSLSLKLNFYVKLQADSTLPSAVQKLLSEYYFRKYVKNTSFLDALRNQNLSLSTPITRIRHSEVSHFQADSESYVKLPNFFYNFFKSLPDYGGMKSFVFKLYWERLPTSYHLRNFRHFVTVNDVCQSCPLSKPETIFHITNECFRALDLRNFILKRLGLSASFFPTVFDVNSWNSGNVGLQFLNLMIMQALWYERNDRLFSNSNEYKTPLLHLQVIMKNYDKNIKKCTFPGNILPLVLSLINI